MALSRLAKLSSSIRPPCLANQLRCLHYGSADKTIQDDELFRNISSLHPVAWVFLGPPGVGKGTYAKLMAKHFGLAHIATGDLIRSEIHCGSVLGKQMLETVKQGKLLPDDMIFELLSAQLAASQRDGKHGYILDGFPRTAAQAERLMASSQVQLALNLSLREEVLVEKCLGRRLCRHCDKNYNVADINLPASNGRPPIVLPPLSPAPECMEHLETRSDDTEEVVRHRLQVYSSQAAPVENVFRARGLLRDFEITAGIPETTPRLLETLRRYLPATPARREQQRSACTAAAATTAAATAAAATAAAAAAKAAAAKRLIASIHIGNRGSTGAYASARQ